LTKKEEGDKPENNILSFPGCETPKLEDEGEPKGEYEKGETTPADVIARLKEVFSANDMKGVVVVWEDRDGVNNCMYSAQSRDLLDLKALFLKRVSDKTFFDHFYTEEEQ
jgi:hypothetical protein